MIPKTAITLTEKRDLLRKKIRNQQIKDSIRSKRKIMIDALFKEYGPASRTVKLHDLYLQSLEKNRLTKDLDNGLLPSMVQHWKVGQHQIYFLLILTNVLCDDVSDHQVYNISAIVRDNLVLDLENKHFVHAISCFLHMLFQEHKKSGSYQQEQVLNQQAFLPVMQAILQQAQTDDVLIRILKVARYIFEDPDQLEAHYKAKRNLKVVSMVMDYHLKLPATDKLSKLEQACFKVYLTVADGYRQKRNVFDTNLFISIAQACLQGPLDTRKLTLLVKTFESIYSIPGHVYSVLDDFTIKSLIPRILKSPVSIWASFIGTLAEDRFQMLIPSLREITGQFVIAFRHEQSVELLQTILGTLLEMSYLERQGKDIRFYQTFSEVGGFNSLQFVSWAIQGNSSLFQVLGQLHHFKQQMENQRRHSLMDSIKVRMQSEE